MNRIFLGGNCAESTWRNELIPMLKIDYFNPVVDSWTPECRQREIEERKSCDFVLYTISKEMTRVYSIAEVVDDSNKRPQKTIFCLLEDGFNKGQLKSLNMVGKMVKENGGQVFNCLEDVAEYVNNKYEESKSIQNLSFIELRKLKQQWYETAQNDGSIKKCYLVGRQLGEDVPHNYGPKYRWIYEDIDLYIDDYGGYMTVKYNGKEVCGTHNERLFVPGDWFKIIEEKAIEAQKLKDDKENSYIEEQRQNLLKELGVD